MTRILNAFALWSGMVGPMDKEENVQEDFRWDKPNGYCSKCGAPLNEALVGGYKLHDGASSVPASAYEPKERK